MTHPTQIIALCTRSDGHVAWQAVANMLGRNLHSVRAEYDRTYLRTPTSEISE